MVLRYSYSGNIYGCPGAGAKSRGKGGAGAEKNNFGSATLLSTHFIVFDQHGQWGGGGCVRNILLTNCLPLKLQKITSLFDMKDFPTFYSY